MLAQTTSCETIHTFLGSSSYTSEIDTIVDKIGLLRVLYEAISYV